MKTCLIRTNDGEQLSYTVSGAGRAVLLIHGFTMWSDMWIANGVVEELYVDVKIIAPDLRGHGMSSRPCDPSGYGRKLVNDLVTILEAEEITKVDVVGFSLGAELALKLVTSEPLCVSSVFLIGSGWSRDDGMDVYREFASWARETGSGMTPNPDYDALDALVAGMPDIIDISKAELERIEVPCAGLVGSDDPERPNLEVLTGVVPGFTLTVLQGVPHETSWRDPSVPMRIRSFLNGV